MRITATPHRLRRLCFGLALALLGGQAALADEVAEANRGTYMDAWEAGRATFTDACAMCHGNYAYGDGASGAMLKKKPADLTQLRLKNGGEFPWIYVYEVIDGRRPVDSHGKDGMPVWGKIWTDSIPYETQRNADVYVRGRIFELLLYLDSIQADAAPD